MRREIGKAILSLRREAEQAAKGEPMHDANAAVVHGGELQSIDILAPFGDKAGQFQASKRR